MNKPLFTPQAVIQGTITSPTVKTVTGKEYTFFQIVIHHYPRGESFLMAQIGGAQKLQTGGEFMFIGQLVQWQEDTLKIKLVVSEIRELLQEEKPEAIPAQNTDTAQLSLF